MPFIFSEYLIYKSFIIPEGKTALRNIKEYQHSILIIHLHLDYFYFGQLLLAIVHVRHIPANTELANPALLVRFPGA